MTSPRPPRLRDTTDVTDRLQQDRANLNQLFVGFHGGRFPPSRRVGVDASAGIFDGADDEGDDQTDEQTPEWEFNDRHLVTVAGGQVATLTKEPTDESLQVYFHPRGLSYAPVRLPAERFSVEANKVTIPDPSSIIEAADAFSFQYQYLTGEDAETLLGAFMLNTRSSSVLDTVTLQDGGDYRVEVNGTFAETAVRIAGANVTLVYPAPGGVGYADADVEWIYGSGSYTGAFPRTVQQAYWPAGTLLGLQYRHGSGDSWHNWTPTTSTPDPNFTYTRDLTGQGALLQFRWVDNPYTDNDGQIRVQVFQE